MDQLTDRVVEFARFGPPDVLEIVGRPRPSVGADEVRVRVAWAGLNPVDYKIRRGGPGYDARLPSRIGRELSGWVEAVGADVSRLSEGDPVFGTIPVGALADAVAVPASYLAPMPDGVAMDVAGGLALAGQTAWDALASQRLEAGDTIVVTAAAGGVGGILSQLAARLGVRVIGSASPGNHAWLRSRGVEPVAYGPGLPAAIRSLAPEGITAAFDLHGAESVRQLLDLGIPPGRVNTNAMGSATPDGVQRVGRGDTDLETLGALAALVAGGELEVPIAARYDLRDVVSAFEFLEAGHLRGKVVVSGAAVGG